MWAESPLQQQAYRVVPASLMQLKYVSLYVPISEGVKQK
jgi:hypothetical protein